MKILLKGEVYSRNELNVAETVQWETTNSIEDVIDYSGIDAVFNMSGNAAKEDYSKIPVPVFINSVTTTLDEMNQPENVVRINGWNGFLKRNSWELAGNPSDEHKKVLDAIGKKIIITADDPGFVSARIISMIINEAFFAKGENISTENEIDIAMKLGTNYPYGPFEWAEQIGISNIYELLNCLSKSDTKYQPSPLLEKKAKDQ